MNDPFRVNTSCKPSAERIAAIQKRIDASSLKNGTATVTVSYDYATQGLKFVDGNGGRIVLKSATGNNDAFGLTSIPTTLSEAGYYNSKVIPNGSYIRPAEDQRFGMSMTFDSVNKTFNLQSNTTGDESSIAITSTNTTAQALFGLSSKDTFIDTSLLAKRGIPSTPAIAKGTMASVDVSNSFAVDDSNNKFVVTVNGLMGTVVLPKGTDYTLDSFMTRLQKGINSLGNNNPDGTPVTVNGVTVSYDKVAKNFVFTTGTTGADSYIKISGSANWGLESVDAGRGTTSSWISPTQHKDMVGGVLQPKFIDSTGNETTNGEVSANKLFDLECQLSQASFIPSPSKVNLFIVKAQIPNATQCFLKNERLNGVAYVTTSPIAGKTERIEWVATAADGRGISFRADR